jgi:2,4-dienoyl-CoA reductase-like NADH-dependent reductase (Old Yellow Enzyme family)
MSAPSDTIFILSGSWIPAGATRRILTWILPGTSGIICGGIYDRKTADDAITDADLVLSGKSLLLNPDWVADIRDNKFLKPRTGAEADVAYTDEPLPYP